MAKTTTSKRAPQRSYSEIFMSSLKEVGGDTGFVSNFVLREKLGWQEDRYNRIKDQLKAENLISIARGKGGTLTLNKGKSDDLPQLFISYSHADEAMKNELTKHLQPLIRMHLIKTWNDRKIPTGGEWKSEIDANLAKSKVILLLISVDFINSKYCFDIELERAMDMHEDKTATVIPVILRSCLWHHMPFAKLQGIPKDGKPVSSWSDKDEAYTHIAERLKEVIENIE